MFKREKNIQIAYLRLNAKLDTSPKAWLFPRVKLCQYFPTYQVYLLGVEFQLERYPERILGYLTQAPQLGDNTKTQWFQDL